MSRQRANFFPSTEMDERKPSITLGRKLTILLSFTIRQGLPSLKPNSASSRPEQGPSQALENRQAFLTPMSLSKSPRFLYSVGSSEGGKGSLWHNGHTKKPVAGNHLSWELKELPRKAYLHSPRRSSGLPGVRRHTCPGTPSWQWCRAGSLPSLWDWR